MSTNRKLAYQMEEEKKRAADLIIVNKELAFQDEEKENGLRSLKLRIKN